VVQANNLERKDGRLVRGVVAVVLATSYLVTYEPEYDLLDSFSVARRLFGKVCNEGQSVSLI
jgi:hypothetical protein